MLLKIKQNYLTKNTCYTKAQHRAVKGLMLHSIGCPQPSASVLMNNYNTPNTGGVCVHGFIDGNDGQVYQTLPWEYRAGHCGKGSSGRTANDTHIAIEMCEPACIEYTGGASFRCSDTAAAKAIVKRTYESAVQLFAYLCKLYNLNPLADGVIISHSEGCARGIASNHGDPVHLWNGLHMGYTMDGFRKDVAKAMNPTFTIKPGMVLKTTRRIPLRSGVSTKTKQAGYVKYSKLKSAAAKKKCRRTLKGNATMRKGRRITVQEVNTSNGNVWVRIKIAGAWLPVVVSGKYRVTKA